VVPGVPLVPLEVLFGNPERTMPRISPDGSRLAWIAPDDGVLNVWVGALGSEEARPVTNDRDRGIRSFFWAHDGRHLLYVQDRGGDENWRLYSADLESREIRDLTPFEGVQARVERVDKNFPHEVLVGLNRDRPQLHDVYRLDLRTGELELALSNPGFAGFVADWELDVRCGIESRPDGGMTIHVRDGADGEWRPLLAADASDALTSRPVGFSRAGRLVRLALDGGEPEVLAEDPEYDVVYVRTHTDTGEPQAVAFLKERAEIRVLDEEIADDVRRLEELEPGDLGLEGNDDADRTWLASFTSDDGPIRYYAYDRDTKSATFLFEHQPELARYDLAPMEPFSFNARDGLTIHGYVSFPLGVERHGLPTVVNVHGGPWARDTWGLNPEVQWLANRGYLCVKVNFRGSTGYGKAFLNAGDREWGGKMHDDLLDAVEEVVRRGWADPERVAIFGGSYGGYAALVGATFTPDVFRCAVDIVGPSNLETLISSIPPYWEPLKALFLTRVGDPAIEPEFMWSRSPLSRVDAIRIPILIAQGANDPRVPQAESEQIVEAMRAKGIDYEYMLFEDEGHGFAKPENRLRFYEAAERFLARHLGGRAA
jgi:dipeptidyl aminopeptidase/acylaminoacyl peptidase